MNHPTMTNRTSTTRTDKEMKKRTGVVKGIDKNNPNDMAFNLVTMFVHLLCCEYSFFCLFLSFFYEVRIPPLYSRCLMWQRGFSSADAAAVAAARQRDVGGSLAAAARRRRQHCRVSGGGGSAPARRWRKLGGGAAVAHSAAAAARLQQRGCCGGGGSAAARCQRQLGRGEAAVAAA